MAGRTLHLAAHRQLALVPQHRLQLGGFANQAQAWLVRALFERGQHRAHTQATHFLVIGKCQVHRHVQRLGKERGYGCQHRGNEAFHVSRASAIQAPATFAQGKRLDRPGLAGHRHYIGVPRQHHAAKALGADGGEQVGFGALRVVEQFAFHPQLGEVITDKADQLKVGVPADGGKADQPGQQRAAGKITHRPAPRSSVQPSGSGRG
ncbi:hypothetical protein D3C76_758740 [compost metagenome]